MSSNRDVFTTEIYVNGEQANEAMAELAKKVDTLTQRYDRMAEKNEKMAKSTEEARKKMEATTKELEKLTEGTKEYADTKKLLDEQTASFNKLDKALQIHTRQTNAAEEEMKAAKTSYENADKGVEKYREALENLSGRSMKNLLHIQRQIKSELDKTKPNTPEWNELSKKYQEVTGRIKTLGKAQDGVTEGAGKLSNGMGGLLGKLGNIGSMITAVPTLLKGVRIGVKAITEVTRQTIQASQTLGDKWNNGMAAMKTTTDAFFMALSTGDWSAFNNGITGALKKARELAEHLDTIADYGIAEGVMQSEYVTDYNQARTVATDTEANAAARQNALRDMENDIQHYSEFVEAKGKETWETLQASFDAWKGLQFDTSEEMHEFVVRYFEYATTGRDKEAQQLKDLKTQMDDAQRTYNRVAAAGGSSAQYLFDQLTEAQQKYYDAYNSASKATQGIVAALELPDDKKKEIANLFSSYAAGLDKVEQMRRRMNTTRDQVTKQINQQTAAIGEQDDGISIIMADIEAWVAKERQAALDRYNANKNSFDKSATAYQDYQDELAAIDAEAETKRESARQKEEARLKAEADKRKAAADKAYQNAQNKIAKAEAAQLNTLKSLYASGLMDKATYEAQKAVVEEDYLKKRMATAEKYGKDTDQFMSQLLDRQIARMEAAKARLKEEADEMAKYYKETHPDQNMSDEDYAKLQKQQRRQGYKEKLGTIPGETDEEFDARIDQYEAFQEKLWAKAADIRAAITEDSARTQYETEMKWIEKLHKDGLLSDEDYEKAKLDQKLKFAAEIAKEVNRYAEMASNFVNALKESETAKMEAEYQAQLTAAGDNAEKREAIEAEYEKKQLDLQKKYADVDMAIQIAQAISAGALAAIQAFTAAKGNPVLGGIYAAIIAATTAAQIATIVAQRNAIKNTTVNSSGTTGGTGQRTITGYAEGGYTEDHSTVTTVGEHGVEWIAPHWMVRKEPVVFRNLESYRRSGSRGRSGSMSRGFADGGYTSTPKGSAMAPQSPVGEIDWQALREFNAVMRYCAENGIFVKYGDILLAKDKLDNIKRQTSRN